MTPNAAPRVPATAPHATKPSPTTRRGGKAALGPPDAPPAPPAWPERMYLVMVTLKFDFTPPRLHGIPVVFDTRPVIGYMPLYATREDAEREHPGKQVLEVYRHAR